MPETQIEALQTERAGYVARGLKVRVAEVDEAIKVAGGEVADETPTSYPEGGAQRLILAYVGDDRDRAVEALVVEDAKGDESSESFVKKLRKRAGLDPETGEPAGD